jgi:hypothetical protein
MLAAGGIAWYAGSKVVTMASPEMMTTVVAVSAPVRLVERRM